MHGVSNGVGVRRVFVHIGLEKAASTTLQASLVAARGALAERGVAFPQMGGGGAKDQRDLREGLPDPRARARPTRPQARVSALSALKLAAKESDTLLLSGETLYDLGPQPLMELLEDGGWGGAPTKAVMIVRDPASWLNSRYAFGAIQFRYTLRFAAHVRQALTRGHVDLWRWLSPWLSSPIDVTAVPLRDRRDKRSGVLRALEALEVPYVVPGEGLNEAVDPRTVEAARRLSATGLADGGRAAVRPARKLLLAAAREAGFTGRFQGMTPRLRRHVEATTRDSHERVAQAVWGAAWDDIYDTPREWAPPNAWRWPGRAEDARAIDRIVEEVCAARGLSKPRPILWRFGARRG